MVGGVSVTMEDVTVKVGASVMVGGASVMVGGASVMVGGVSVMVGGASVMVGGVSVMVGVNVLVGDVTVMVGGVSGDVADVYNVLCLPVPRFGMHEDYDYYVNCKLRQRNMGLFTADQVGGNSLSGGCHMWA